MRVIKEILYPDCKVSIFYMNQKYIIRFEQNNLEQIYKFSEIDFIIGDIADFEKMIETSLLMKSISIFNEMKVAISEASIDLI
jgi:hypothetical protein